MSELDAVDFAILGALTIATASAHWLGFTLKHGEPIAYGCKFPSFVAPFLPFIQGFIMQWCSELGGVADELVFPAFSPKLFHLSGHSVIGFICAVIDGPQYGLQIRVGLEEEVVFPAPLQRSFSFGFRQWAFRVHAFVLALFSAFFRWLRLFCVRALNLVRQIKEALNHGGYGRERSVQFHSDDIFEPHPIRKVVLVDLLNVGCDIELIPVHVIKDASARARRQAQAVLERPEKRQNRIGGSLCVYL